MKSLTNKLIIILAFLNIIIIIYILKIYTTLPSIQSSDFYINDEVTILDSTSNIINHKATFKTSIKYEQISQNVINSLISTEDEAFFIHNGINPKRIVKALIKDIKSFKAKEGASTITQQVIKNKYLSSDKSINRKLKEMMLALKLERILTKEEIITYYLNNVLFSDNIYGIYNASLYFFDKEPINLTIDEASTLVGLIQLPNFYNPYKNLEKCSLRRNIVLKALFKNNFITQDELDFYRNINLYSKLKKNEKFINTSYYNQYLDIIDNKVGTVSTYMNKDIQYTLYEIATNKLNFLPDDDINIGLICIDNNTNGILGIYGNRTPYKKTINTVLQKRHMASCMKPIMDYLPYFETTNNSPASVIIDDDINYSNGTKLKNWDNLYKGAISIRQALSESRNIPALKIFNMTSYEKKKEILSRVNLELPGTLYEADSIGCGNALFSLYDIASCYTAFANMGKFRKVEAIVNEEPYLQVMRPTSAFFINTILHDVFKSSSYNIDGYMMAKTGQTNYDSDTIKKYNIPQYATKDSYVISYTKDITLGIYIGYDKISSTCYLDRQKTQIPRTIMKYFMRKYQNNAKEITIPSDITYKKCNIINNELYLDDNGKYDYFIKDVYPDKYKKRSYFKI